MIAQVTSHSNGADIGELIVSGGRYLTRTPRPDRQTAYDDEVRRIVVATRVVSLRTMWREQPRVADIVREAGMSNQAFYRHFRSRDDAIVATYEQGLLQVHEYLAHQVVKHGSPADQLRAWITGLLAQVRDPSLSDLSSAILWNVAQIPPGASDVEPRGHDRIFDQLTGILRSAGIPAAEERARLVGTLVLGVTDRYRTIEDAPTEDERDLLVAFCLDGLGLS